MVRSGSKFALFSIDCFVGRYYDMYTEVSFCMRFQNWVSKLAGHVRRLREIDNGIHPSSPGGGKLLVSNFSFSFSFIEVRWDVPASPRIRRKCIEVDREYRTPHERGAHRAKEEPSPAPVNLFRWGIADSRPNVSVNLKTPNLMCRADYPLFSY